MLLYICLHCLAFEGYNHTPQNHDGHCKISCYFVIVMSICLLHIQVNYQIAIISENLRIFPGSSAIPCNILNLIHTAMFYLRSDIPYGILSRGLGRGPTNLTRWKHIMPQQKQQVYLYQQRLNCG